MLKATTVLVDNIRTRHPGSISASVVAEACSEVIVRHGGLEDADVLVDLFLEDPTDYWRAGLLNAIMWSGNVEHASKLATACVSEGELREGTQSAVLHTLGFLGYSEARDLLWRYAQDRAYDLQKHACLGLLNLSCDGLESQIEMSIQACVGKNTFPEFLPALACKAHNPKLVETIFELGRTTASTDCNGGIVYGTALFQEAGQEYFDQLLFDPHWEAGSLATGTGLWAYHGFRHRGGSLSILARQLREDHATMAVLQWQYRVQIWCDLLQIWFCDPLPVINGILYCAETAADIYRAAFDWSSPDADDSLTGPFEPDTWERKHLHALSERLSERIKYDIHQQSLD